MEQFNEIKAKISLNQNTYDYWVEGEGKDTIPLYGEVLFCEIAGTENSDPITLFKVGTAKLKEDGTYIEGTAKKFEQLNWVSALAADVFPWAKENYISVKKIGSGEVISNIQWNSTENGGKGGLVVESISFPEFIGKKGTGNGAEIFNDYENNNAFGDYSSTHGKSTTNFNDITTPEAIYYKALPGAKTHPDVEYFDGFDLQAEFYNPGWYNEPDTDYRIKVRESDMNKLPSDCYFSFGLIYEDSTSEEGYITIEQSIKLNNGECIINLSSYRDAWDFYENGIEDANGNRVNVYYEVGAKYVYPEKYNFEDYTFTFDSTDSLGQVDNVYKYVDKWGNICYTLDPSWHPNVGSYYSVEEWEYRREVGHDDHLELALKQGEKYKIVLSPEFMASEAYTRLKDEGYIEIYEDSHYYTNFYYEDFMSVTDTVELYNGAGSTGDRMHPLLGSKSVLTYFGFFTDGYEGVVGTLYEYIKSSPVMPVEDDDPILKTIKYEALANNGEKFSLADGKASAVFGIDSIANGDGAFAAGNQAMALAPYSAAFGKNALIRSENSMAIGTNKVEQNAVLMVGNGKSPSERSNALVSYRDGRLEIGADPINDMDVVTKKYLDNLIGDINAALQAIISQQQNIMNLQYNLGISDGAEEV